MEEGILARINEFLAPYSTLVIATEHEGQPFATRIFFVAEPATESTCRLYATLITSSRKLANLQQNPQVGIFIGPDQPSSWMEATAHARVLNDEQAKEAREKLARKSATAATFLARVPTAAIELDVNWLRITDLTTSTPYIEATFAQASTREE